MNPHAIYLLLDKVMLTTPEVPLDKEASERRGPGRPRGKMRKVAVAAVRRSSRHSSNKDGQAEP